MTRNNAILILLIFVALLSITSYVVYTGQIVGGKNIGEKIVSKDVGLDKVVINVPEKISVEKIKQPPKPEPQPDKPVTPEEPLPIDDFKFSTQALSIGWNYQENGNSSSCAGSWHSSGPCANIYDGNYSTYAFPNSGSDGIFYVDYAKPVGVSNIKWQIKDSSANINYSICDTPQWSDCCNIYPDFKFKVNISDSGSSSSNNWYCQNTTGDWIRLRQAPASPKGYEEGLWMEFTNNVTFCSDLTTDDTVYTMIEDVFNIRDDWGETACMEIRGDNITLDCAGHTIMNQGIALKGSTDMGILVGSVSNDIIIKNCIVKNYTYTGIHISYTDNITLINNTFINNEPGISIDRTNNSRLINNTVISPDLVSANSFAFYSQMEAYNNTVINLKLANATKNTTVSFTYEGPIQIRHALTPTGGNPIGYTDIGHYIEINNPWPYGGWIFLNMSYEPEDVSFVHLPTLKIFKNSSGEWSQNLNLTGNLVSGIDTTSRYVYANISNFSSVFAPLGVSTSITSCDNLTGTNITYKLTTNLSGTQSGQNYCINISADNVILDCDGHIINGSDVFGSNGIVAYYLDNVTIINCKIMNYQYGFDGGINNSNISNNLFYDNEYSINIWDSQNTIIQGNDINDSTNSGMYIYDCAGLLVYDNNVTYSNPYGIYFESDVSGNHNNNITDNYFGDNTWDFDLIDVTSDNLFLNNDFSGTVASFTSEGRLALVSETTVGGDPFGYTNISHYLNITNNSAGAWIYINVSYLDPSDLNGVDEITLKLFKNSSGTWTDDIGTINNVNTVSNYVYANISKFESLFAPLGVVINVSDCVNITIPNFVYTLSKNLTDEQSGWDRCVFINGTNITLDCDGYNITNVTSGDYGIYVEDSSNVTVHNCSVYDYDVAGIYVTDSVYTNLTENNLIGNVNGIYDLLTSYSTILLNYIFNNDDIGIKVYKSNETDIFNNTVLYNQNIGIYVGSAVLNYNTSIKYNNIFYNG